MKHFCVTFIFIIFCISITACKPNPDQLIEMVTPVVYEISKVTDKYDKKDGSADIKIKYENIRFTDSDFPTGEFDIVASSNFTDNKEIRLNYKFNGSYIADVAIFYNKNDKEYRTVNLADNSIVKGKTSNIDNHIKSLAQKIIISKLGGIKNQRVAIFPFPTLDNKYFLFGNYIGENITNELVNNNIKVVERGLLRELFKEFTLKQTGIVEYGKEEIDKIINITGATAIVTGTLSIINDDLVVNCRVISTTGDVISSGKETMKLYLIPKNYLKK